jgi:hypothetical protein
MMAKPRLARGDTINRVATYDSREFNLSLAARY